MATSYEIAVMDGKFKIKRVLGYSERKTKSVLLQFAQRNGKYISTLLTDAQLDMEWRYSAKDETVWFGGHVVGVGFDGFTKLNPSS